MFSFIVYSITRIQIRCLLTISVCFKVDVNEDNTLSLVQLLVLTKAKHVTAHIGLEHSVFIRLDRICEKQAEQSEECQDVSSHTFSLFAVLWLTRHTRTDSTSCHINRTERLVSDKDISLFVCSMFKQGNDRGIKEEETLFFLCSVITRSVSWLSSASHRECLSIRNAALNSFCHHIC